MGKVKDGVPASKPSKPAKGKPGGRLSRSAFAQFLPNLVQTELYKPMQGWYARLYTALGPGSDRGRGSLAALRDARWTTIRHWRFGIPAALALVVLGWLIFRIVQFPPFAEFLIATEAEMNKVSWTSKDDLYRATTVVLPTVVLMAVFLFGVDWLWSFILLQIIGVLQFGGGGGFGSTAGLESIRYRARPGPPEPSRRGWPLRSCRQAYSCNRP